MSDLDENESHDAPNRELPRAALLCKDAEFCEPDRVFLTPDALKCLSLNRPTPFYLYDGAGMQRSIVKLFDSLSFLPRCSLYLPVRFCAYRELITHLSQAGVGFMCETPEELELVCSCGVAGDRIRYSALLISRDTALKLRQLGATIIIYSVMNLPNIMPRNVDFCCSDFSMAGVAFTYSELERSRLGLNIKEISRLIPLFRDIGAESFGLTFPVEHSIKREDIYRVKLQTIYQAAKLITKKSGTAIDRLDLGNGYFANYSKPESLTDDTIVTAMLNSVLSDIKEPYEQTIYMCPISRILARFALLVTSVQGMYRHHGLAVVVNASCESIDDSTVRKRCHVCIAGREWMDDRSLCYIAGMRAQDSDYFKRSATVRPPEIGDLIVFHDIGAAIPLQTPHAAYLYLANGSVLPMTR